MGNQGKVLMLHVGRRLATSPAGDDPRPSGWALSSDWEVAGPKSRPQNHGSESGSVHEAGTLVHMKRPLGGEWEVGDRAEVSGFRGVCSESAGKGARHL